MKRSASNTQPANTASSSASPAGTSVLSVLSLLESLTLAFTLALIIRGFVVEAFVIPTGSMAESLMGKHTETICKTCRYTYATGIPAERTSNSLVCPNCGDRSQRVFAGPAFRRAGDRVLVLKPMYFLSRYESLSWLAPKRWDVVVFLFPGNGRDNYIKRLTGLPGETIEVIDGDVYIDGRIARKPPDVQQELWIPIFDNDYQRSIPGQGWPRWKADSENSNIDRLHDGRLIRLRARGAAHRTIAYDGPIDNALAYNALSMRSNHMSVTDLRLGFDIIPRDFGPSAQVTAVLSKGDQRFRLRLDLSDLASPYIELQHSPPLLDGSGHSQWRTFLDDADLPLRYNMPQTLGGTGGRSVRLALQNVDYRVSVWVDGRQVLATTDGSYGPGPLAKLRLLNKTRQTQIPRPRVFISARDCEVDLLHINLDRDVYYALSERRVADAQVRQLHGQQHHACGRPFYIPSNDDIPGSAYFMLGDNSSASQDSRLWRAQHSGLDDTYVPGTVPRDHMIGQAFFVYWPAAGPLVGRQLPLVPRVGKMRLIH